MAKTKQKGLIERPPGSGKWWVRIWLQGRDRWFRVASKTEGKALYGRLKAEALEGKFFERPKAIPFRTIAKEYSDRLMIRQRRKQDDQSRLRFWTRVFGEQDASKISVRDIEQALSELAQTRKPATVIRHLTTLKALLNHAKRLNVIKENPASLVKTPKVDNMLVRYLSDEQETQLLEVLKSKYVPIVLMALNTGCRQGELLRLRWSDIDWNAGTLTIRETKAGETRRTPLNSIAQQVLSELKSNHSPEPGDRIFSFDARNLRREFDRAVKALGLSPFRFHDLRHTFASRLAMKGANDRTLMALGGWKSPAMLSRYAHLSPTHLWNAIEGLTVGKTLPTIQSVAKSVAEETREEEKSTEVVDFNGEPRAARTLDPRLKRAMLYQLS